MNFTNPYALTKAMAAGTIAENVGKVSTKACFKVKDKERYIKLVSAAHEMAFQAAKLAEEARNLEKGNDTVNRTPHHKRGHSLSKSKLMEKPQ